MTVKNKIMDKLKELNKPTNTKELAELCNINYTNITKYLKPLELEGKITRKREGKNTMIELKVVEKILHLEKPKPILQPIIKKVPTLQFDKGDLQDILMCIHNWFSGYRKNYNKVKNIPYAETKVKWERLLILRDKADKKKTLFN